jgi:lipopolysaccharide transport system ATP-binding protein
MVPQPDCQFTFRGRARLTAPAVHFDCVSKRFLLQREKPRSFQELALNLLRLKGNGPREEFWALRDVSFRVQSGEMLGIIGPNGAGKSTILKLISRIIEPTSGHIAVNGRVSALLELGTGFHPDLTGRENVFLNAAILGLSRRDIRHRFDDIVDFSGIGAFIDSPVKHYSSGMFMRLGFSIAVNVSPDILLIDEVLAVGDLVFRQRCLKKIGEIRRQGTTILFVSHDLKEVGNSCDRVLWMKEGQLAAKGSSDKVVNQYVAHTRSQMTADAVKRGQVGSSFPRWGTREIEITGVRFYDAQGQETHRFATGERLEARISYRASSRIKQPVFGVAIFSSDGLHIAGPNVKTSGYDIPYVEGEGELAFFIEPLPLLQGYYELSVSAHNYDDTHTYDHHNRAYIFEVEQGQVQQIRGRFCLPVHWQLRSGETSA